MDRAIIVDHLVKNFSSSTYKNTPFETFKSFVLPRKNTVHAVSSISFAIQPGEIVGLIGTSGSGKTTILKTLSGLTSPTSGFVEVLEYDPWERKPEFLKEIGLIMGGKSQLLWNYPATDTFNLNRAIYEIPTREFEENISEFSSYLGVEKLINIPVRKLSIGQRVRIEFLASLLHRPKILFLDEPTLGIDLATQQKIRDFIYIYNKKNNATIIFGTQKLDDLADLARRTIVLNSGSCVFDGTFEELVNKFAQEKIIDVILSNDKNIDELEKIGKIKKMIFPHVLMSVPRNIAAVAAAELLQNFPIDNLKIEEPFIEDVVKKMNIKND